MRIRRMLILTIALAIAMSLLPLSKARAATLAAPATALGAGRLLQTVKVEKKGKHAKSRNKSKHHGKRAGGKGGRCGAFMYYSAKGGKCLDARSK